MAYKTIQVCIINFKILRLFKYRKIEKLSYYLFFKTFLKKLKKLVSRHKNCIHSRSKIILLFIESTQQPKNYVKHDFEK